jgi:hypothetical protein
LKIITENLAKLFTLKIWKKIIGYINGIKRSGLSTSEVGYGNWVIAFTEKGVYFVKLSSHFTGPVGALGGALGGFLVNKASEFLSKSKGTEIMGEEISNFLAGAQSHFEFKIEDIKKLTLERSLFLSSINTISFMGKENNKIKIVLNEEQYMMFKEGCKTFYSYDASKYEKKSSILKSLLELSEK